jgi:hypothetical protein
MKIDRSGPIRSSAPAKRSGKSDKTSGDFSKHIEGAAGTQAGVSSVAPVQSLDAVLMIQELEDSTSGGGKAKAQKWGHDLLDQLDQLRIGIIGGVIAESELTRIANMVEVQRARTDDPALSLILDEIELRAKVELAKYDRDRRF